MLSIKPNHKPIKDYYSALDTFGRLGISHETAVRNAFQSVLNFYCRQLRWDFVEEFHFKRPGRFPASIDGAMFDQFRVPQGYWEAKDTQDDLAKEVVKKFSEGYPRDNIIFQSPERAILYQGNTRILDEDITSPNLLVQVLYQLFSYKTDIQLDWENAVEEFKQRIPEFAGLLVNLIEKERIENKRFIDTFSNFKDIVKASVNPNLSDVAIEEMLVQHLLTERIFRKVFENSDFVNRNIIAVEIEKVIQALTSRTFSRQEFFKPLDRFYVSLEKRAQTIDDFNVKQTFLNTVYEKFFQGFAVKVADTHGIVYTPQPIVEFMINSVDEILKKEFGKTLSSPNVAFLDPFSGTSTFGVNLLKKINKTDLKYKYQNEIFCNEIMLLPYYISTMNMEHTYYELTGEYLAFPGMCLVDSFQVYEGVQTSLFTQENTERVQREKEAKIFVFAGNPPYNAGQVNENDNNKNRKYKTLDKRVSDTYGKDSKATLLRKLQDPYVKAFRMASDEIVKNGEGVIAYISNNSFIDDTSFDGMRKNLFNDFDIIYIVDLKGNIRKDSMKDGIPLGETHTVFGLGAMVGISITILIKKPGSEKKIYYSDVDFRATRTEKFKYLENANTVYSLPVREVIPDKNNNWLNEGMQDDWEQFIEIGNKAAKAGGTDKAIFKLFSLGISTNRDSWTYNSSKTELEKNIKNTIEFYNEQVFKYSRTNPKPKPDDFVNNDDTKISWSRDLKLKLQRNKLNDFEPAKLRNSLYRPFYYQRFYFDRTFVDILAKYPYILPTLETENENLVICFSAIGNTKPFHSLIVNCVPDLHLTGDSQCFPFYSYNEDGTGRKENITDWALKEFRKHYQDEKINKWDIFYYIYGVLHKPEYRTKYAANLRRELPRIPYYEDFWKYSEAGKKLADLHVNYEEQLEYPLTKIEAPDKQLDYRVEKMRLSKDKQALVYNDFLTLTGIPLEAYEYKLGNRSALEWIIDQYQIKTDKRSSIVNDPNRADEPDYILKLIGKIVTVSLETVKIVREL